MKPQIMILAVALVTIIRPAAGIVYTQCQLTTLVINNGITTNVSDCKYSTAQQLSLKTDLMKVYCNDMHLINQAQKTNAGKRYSKHSNKTSDFLK
jgi:hypothetical protein